MDYFVMNDFKIDLSFEEVVKRLHLEEPEDQEFMRPYYDTALKIARPKGVYRACSVDSIKGEQVVISGTEFESRVMANNLKGVEQVYAYVVTCGREVDDWSHQETDPIVGLWLDMLKEMILRKAVEPFFTQLAHTEGIKQYATMSPGSGNADIWPIGQQKKLFSLIGEVEQNTGARLTDSCLMLPTKSVSGILYPSEKGFITCTLCTRERCPNRRAPYNPLKDEMM